MTDDTYTMDMRLCDDAGMTSNELIDDGKPSCDKTYLDRLNRLRNISLTYRGDKPEFITEPFACTGHAHLAYEHIRCTSKAHRYHTGPNILSLDPCPNCWWSPQFCHCNDNGRLVIPCYCGPLADGKKHHANCPAGRVLEMLIRRGIS